MSQTTKYHTLLTNHGVQLMRPGQNEIALDRGSALSAGGFAAIRQSSDTWRRCVLQVRPQN
jgi:hypothetical protein